MPSFPRFQGLTVSVSDLWQAGRGPPDALGVDPGPSARWTVPNGQQHEPRPLLGLSAYPIASA
jgi:hypothetical protein